MPATLTKPVFDQQSFEAFLHARNEPAWLIEQRREAWQSFCEKDWPQRNDEEWIRTDIRLFKLNQFALPIGNLPDDDAYQKQRENILPVLTENVKLAGHSISLDSRSPDPFDPAFQLDDKYLEKGVLFGSLDYLVRSHGELIRKHLFTRAV